SPPDLTFVEVDGNKISPGRPVARTVVRGEQLAVHLVPQPCPFAREDPPKAGPSALHHNPVGVLIVRVGKLHELDRMHQVVDRYVEPACLRIETGTRPVRAATSEGIQNRATLTRRCEDPLVAQLPQPFTALLQPALLRLP